ncbi:hypothetical protein CLAFUW4_10351 [Fulvia fulva]|nr:hypothetical protein CLAFUR4_10355 [Fulvia fulva]WPV18878.1 hypothetical protein CLAFUW4_10351 [Fulvia fulva]WPV34475.1 hypothetical protein CLAFUW7_10351 [Fulvia fulva]
MDLELQNILRSVRDGDLILINGASIPSTCSHFRPTYLDHLLVVVNNAERIRRGEDPFFVLVAPINARDARDLLLPNQPMIWSFNYSVRRVQALPIEQFMRRGFSSVILRPSIEVLRATIWQGQCPFECDRGTIRITPRTSRELGIFVSHGRALGNSWTLCPYCMDPELFQNHEEMVQNWSRISMFNIQQIHTHVRQVNHQRRLLHFRPFPLNIDLPTLASGTQTYLVMQYQGSAHQHPHAAEIGSSAGLISKPASYFMVTGVMVPGDDDCVVCKDIFNENDPVVELPCGHRFHCDCLAPWLDQGNKTCPTCRAVVPE